MAFNSFSFFVFLPLVWGIYQVVPDRWRWLVLLAASYCFYAALGAPHLVLLLGGVTVVNYWFGAWLDLEQQEARRRWLLGAGVLANVSVLACSKVVPMLERPLALDRSFLITVGISYFTFQAISYLVDVYLEVERHEPHLGYFALYLSFFPKLLQGPIERTGELLHQFRVPYRFDYENARTGAMLFTWGLFQKVVLADRLGLFVNTIYDAPRAYAGLPLLLASYLYAFQLYFDFAAYTDMARGVARLFNIELVPNFNAPYLATSIAEFWRRWHMSFSRWILDYIFKPLQMRWRDWRTTGTAAALLVTFLISGLWHGAAWGFLCWGALHGCYLALSLFYKPYQKRIHKALRLEKTQLLRCWQIFFTFNATCLAWVFFRANTLSDAFYIVTHLAGGPLLPAQLMARVADWKSDIVIALLASLALILAKRVGRQKWEQPPLVSAARPLRWAVYYALMMAIISFNAESNRAFMYLQF